MSVELADINMGRGIVMKMMTFSFCPLLSSMASQAHPSSFVTITTQICMPS